jgi:putative flippase GtrA
LVGGVFLGIGLSLLKLFVEVFGWPFWAATLVQAEACTLLRFLANGLQQLDVPYLWAAALAVVLSTMLSLATNFLWVWRREGRALR